MNENHVTPGDTVADSNFDSTCSCSCTLDKTKYASFLSKESELARNIASLTQHGFINRLASLKFKNPTQTKQDFAVIVEDLKSFKELIIKQEDIDELIDEKEMVCDESYTYILKDYQAKLSDELKKLKEKLDAIEQVANQISKAITQWSKNGVMKEREGFWYFRLTSGVLFFNRT